MPEDVDQVSRGCCCVAHRRAPVLPTVQQCTDRCYSMQLHHCMPSHCACVPHVPEKPCKPEKTGSHYGIVLVLLRRLVNPLVQKGWGLNSRPCAPLPRLRTSS
jgi:hypothetical protein